MSMSPCPIHVQSYQLSMMRQNKIEGKTCSALPYEYDLETYECIDHHPYNHPSRPIILAFYLLMRKELFFHMTKMQRSTLYRCALQRHERILVSRDPISLRFCPKNQKHNALRTVKTSTHILRLHGLRVRQCIGLDKRRGCDERWLKYFDFVTSPTYQI